MIHYLYRDYENKTFVDVFSRNLTPRLFILSSWNSKIKNGWLLGKIWAICQMGRWLVLLYPTCQATLRASFCKFREWDDNREISDFFIFCPNNLYRELFLKIPFKGPDAL